MRNLTPTSITQAFADYAKNAPSERTRTLLVGLAGHLHSFVRENKVTQAEWGAAIDALTRAEQVHRRQAQRVHPVLRPAGRVLAGRHGERRDRRHAVLGTGAVPDRRRARAGQRRRSVEGQVGEPLVVSGQITDQKGAPAKGAVLALWQNGGNGLYSQQDPRGVADQLSRAAHGGRRRQLRLLDGAAGLLHRARRRPGRRHAARAGPQGLAAGAPPHDHPGARPQAADHRVLPRGRQVSRPRCRVRRARRPGAAVQEGHRSASLPANLAARDTLPLPVWTATLDLTLPPA